MIYLIITCSINNKSGIVDFEQRKKNYLESITQTLSILPPNIKPIIVENNGLRETYLDNFQCDVHYTNNNSVNYVHKGVNELCDIKYIIEKYNINDDDVIIKLTGRYHPIDDSFYNLVMNYNNFEAYVKFFNVCTLQFMNDDCVLGMFAIKCKYLKKFSYNGFKSPEIEFATFIRNNIDSTKIYNITQLNLRCCFADNLRILDV